MLQDLLTGVGLVFFIEGIVYALAPQTVQKYMKRVAKWHPFTLRRAGFYAALFGLMLVWAARNQL